MIHKSVSVLHSAARAHCRCHTLINRSSDELLWSTSGFQMKALWWTDAIERSRSCGHLKCCRTVSRVMNLMKHPSSILLQPIRSVISWCMCFGGMINCYHHCSISYFRQSAVWWTDACVWVVWWTTTIDPASICQASDELMSHVMNRFLCLSRVMYWSETSNYQFYHTCYCVE